MSAPTWYDVLGIERDASPDEVRAAWRAATDRAEPGSGQFRAANEAAETLLDLSRRAAYDAELAPAVPRATAPAAVSLTKDEETETPEPVDVVPVEPGRADEAAAVERRPGLLVRVFGRVPTMLLVALLVLVLALAGAGVWLVGQVRAEARVADAREQVTVAAEQAAEAIFSYDYQDLRADQERAEGYAVDGEFKTELVKSFRLLSEQTDGSPGPAVQTKTVVQAQSRGSGVVDVSDDGRTARVLVFVNQTSEKEGQDPQVFLNRIAMTMKEQDGRWLVSDVRSY